MNLSGIEINSNAAFQLQRVKPHKTLLCWSYGCERQAAAIRNATVLAMEESDIALVAYRYLQSRRGEKNTSREVIAYGFTVISALCVLIMAYKDPNDSLNILKKVLCLALILISLPNTLVNIPNTIRHKRTKQACEAWIIAGMDEKDFQEIQKLRYDRSGLASLSSFFKNKGIPTESLDAKLLKSSVNTLIKNFCP